MGTCRKQVCLTSSKNPRNNLIKWGNSRKSAATTPEKEGSPAWDALYLIALFSILPCFLVVYVFEISSSNPKRFHFSSFSVMVHLITQKYRVSQSNRISEALNENTPTEMEHGGPVQQNTRRPQAHTYFIMTGREIHGNTLFLVELLHHFVPRRWLSDGLILYFLQRVAWLWSHRIPACNSIAIAIEPKELQGRTQCPKP
jgi:hypothetical protein